MPVVVLVVDDPVVTEQLRADLGAGGLSAVRPPKDESHAAVLHPGAICIADRGADRDRGIDILRQARAAGAETPFIFVNPSKRRRDAPPWEGRGVVSIEPYVIRTVITTAASWARRIAADPEALLRLKNLEFGDITVDCGRLDLYVKGNPTRLTPTQFRFVHLLATQHPRYVTQREISEEVWGRRQRPGDKHVAYAVKSIRRKVRAVDPSLSIIGVRKRVGYRFSPSRPDPSAGIGYNQRG